MQKRAERMLNYMVCLIILLSIFTAYIPSTSLAEDSIEWFSFKEGVQLAQEKDKPVFIDFWAPWCGPCKEMEEQVYPEQEVIDESENFVCIKVNTNEQPDLAKNFSISSIPTLLFYTPDGTELLRRVGYRDKQDLISDMETALQEYEKKKEELPEIDWFDYEEGRTKSKNEDKPIMIYFKKKNCSKCDRMEEEAFKHVQVADYANNDFVSIKVNASERPTLAEKHDISIYPTLLFLYPDGSHLGISEDYASPPMLIGRMESIINKYEDTTGSDGDNNDSPGLEMVGITAVIVTTSLIVKRRKH